MKHLIRLLLFAATVTMASCAAPSDPTFMNNVAAGIQGGPVMTPEGVMFSPGQDNRNREHPFFGAR